MKILAVLLLASLAGCKMTSVKTVHGPTIMPTPHESPAIQPTTEPVQLGWFGKLCILGLVAGGAYTLWSWDDD